LILNSKGDALFSEFSKNHPSWLTFGEILGVVLILGFVGPSLERFAMRWRSKLMAGI
jgi:hypothetical protein